MQNTLPYVTQVAKAVVYGHFPMLTESQHHPSDSKHITCMMSQVVVYKKSHSVRHPPHTCFFTMTLTLCPSRYGVCVHAPRMWAIWRLQQKWHYRISKAKWRWLGSPWEGYFWKPATISRGSPSSPRKPTQGEPKLPAEASTRVGPSHVWPSWMWVTQRSVELPQLVPGGTDTNFLPTLQILSKISQCSVLSHCVWGWFAMQL